MPKIDLRQAIHHALTYIDNIREQLGKNIDNILLEETELSEDKKFWLITIGFDREVDPTKEKVYISNPLFPDVTNSLPKQERVTIERVYKTFKVDAATGKVISMKIYQF